MPRDIKPFSEREQADILRTVRTHPRLRRAMGGRGRVVLIPPNFMDRREKEGPSQAVVGVYDYDRNRALLALVDPRRKKVLRIEEPRAMMQLDDHEKREAEELASADPRVKRFLRRRPMNPLTRLYLSPRLPRDHRCAIVFLRPTSNERSYAVFDLSSREVLEILRPEGLVL